MAEAHKYGKGGLNAALEVYPDLPWSANGDGEVWVYDEKADEQVPVSEGQFIYKVGDRFEVRDAEELPKSTKPATDADEKPVEKAKAKAEAAKASDDAE